MTEQDWGADPDVGVLVQLGEVQHVVQGQHARGGLGEVHGRVHVVLRSQETGRGGERQEAGLNTKPFMMLCNGRNHIFNI